MISKAPTKTKKTSVPSQVPESADRTEVPVKGQKAKKKKAPPLPFQNKKSSSLDQPTYFIEGSQRPDVSNRSGPAGMDYAELKFCRGGRDYETAAPPVASTNPVEREPPPAALPYDNKTKYAYSTILFDEEKRKNIIAAERLKKDRGPPPPPPGKYQGDGAKNVKKLRQYLSDSNAVSLQPKEQKFQGKARPISAGANRTPATALPVQNGPRSTFPDYEEIDLEEEEEEEFENVPRKSRSLEEEGPRGDPRAPNRSPPVRQAAVDTNDKLGRTSAGHAGGRQAGTSGYENVELDGDDRLGRATDRSDRDRMNQPLPPLPGEENHTAQQTPPQPTTRPSQLIPQKQPSPPTRNGGTHDYVNVQYSAATSTAPQPKPRYIQCMKNQKVYLHNQSQT